MRRLAPTRLAPTRVAPTRLALAISLALSSTALALSPVINLAEVIQGRDWQLLAIDGTPLGADVSASLRFEADGQVSGQAPCNSFSTENRAVLPELSLGPILATKMACAALAEEVNFFNALSAMQAAALDGDQTLILTGPDARSMEFVLDRTTSQTACKTCKN